MGNNSGLLVGIIRSKNRADFFGRFLAKKIRPFFIGFLMIFCPKICRDVEKSKVGNNLGFLVGIIRSKNRANFFGRFLANKIRPIFLSDF